MSFRSRLCNAVSVNLFFFLHKGMQSMKKYISIKFKSNFWSRICTFSRDFRVLIQYIGDFCLLIAILRWNLHKILFQRLSKWIFDFRAMPRFLRPTREIRDRQHSVIHPFWSLWAAAQFQFFSASFQIHKSSEHDSIIKVIINHNPEI